MIIDIQQMSVGSPRTQISEMKGGPELGGELHQWFSGSGGIDAPGCQAINYIFGLFQFLSKSCLRSQAITVSCARASQSLTTVEFVQCERDSLHVPDSRTAGDSKLYQHFIHASEAGVS